jgi:hypothetical protein
MRRITGSSLHGIEAALDVRESSAELLLCELRDRVRWVGVRQQILNGRNPIRIVVDGQGGEDDATASSVARPVAH